jgi:hypothetical protein
MSWLDALLNGYNTVQSAGAPVIQRPTLNFIGTTVADDPTNNRTNVTGLAVSATPNATPNTIVRRDSSASAAFATVTATDLVSASDLDISADTSVSVKVATEDRLVLLEDDTTIIGGNEILLTVDAATSVIDANGATFPGFVTMPDSRVYIKRTTDQSVTSSTTPVDDDTLQLPVDPDEQWIIEVMIAISCSNTGGHLLRPTAPSGAAGVEIYQNGGYGTNIVNYYDTLAAPVSLQVNGLGVLMVVQYRIWLTNGSTAGTFKTRFAQMVSDATATKHLTGSYLMATRVA